MNKLRVIAFILMIIAPVYAYPGQIGAKAPSFALPDLSGKTISLEQFNGKVVFLDFWAPWCVPCRQELPELDKLYVKYRKDGFEVIAISVDPSEKNVLAFLKKFPVSIYVLIDKKDEASDTYRVSSLPTGFILGRDGVIHRVHKGFSTESLPLYEKEIDALLKQ